MEASAEIGSDSVCKVEIENERVDGALDMTKLDGGGDSVGSGEIVTYDRAIEFFQKGGKIVECDGLGAGDAEVEENAKLEERVKENSELLIENNKCVELDAKLQKDNAELTDDEKESQTVLMDDLRNVSNPEDGEAQLSHEAIQQVTEATDDTVAKDDSESLTEKSKSAESDENLQTVEEIVEIVDNNTECQNMVMGDDVLSTKGDGAESASEVEQELETEGTDDLMPKDVPESLIQESESIEVIDDDKESQTVVTDDVVNVSGPEDDEAESANEVEQQLEAEATNVPKVEDDSGSLIENNEFVGLDEKLQNLKDTVEITDDNKETQTVLMDVVQNLSSSEEEVQSASEAEHSSETGSMDDEIINESTVSQVSEISIDENQTEVQLNESVEIMEDCPASESVKSEHENEEHTSEDEKFTEEINNAQLQLDEKTRCRDAISDEIQMQKEITRAQNEACNAANLEVKAAKGLVKSKGQEIDYFQRLIKNTNPVADIDSRICKLVHMKNHETSCLEDENQVVREIKQLKSIKQLALNVGFQDETQQALYQKDQIQEHVKRLKKELKFLKDGVSKAEVAAKSIRNKYEVELEKERGLRTQLKAANELRQGAYVRLINLKNNQHDKASDSVTIPDEENHSDDEFKEKVAQAELQAQKEAEKKEKARLKWLESDTDESHLLNLPPHVLEMLLDFCVGVDYLKFRSTCKSCHFAAPLIPWNNRKASNIMQKYLVPSPWLIVFDKHKGVITLTDPMFGDKYFIKTPQELICDLEIKCSRFGWLLIMKPDKCSLMFYNPFTSDILELPELTATQSLSFSAPPTSSECVVVGITLDMVCYACIHIVGGEPSWRRLQLDVMGEKLFSCITFYGSDLYALREDGGLDVWKEMDKDARSWVREVAKAPASCCKVSPECFQLICDQHLLQVIVGKFGESIEVFKITCRREWEKMDTLGKHMIFICGASSLCLDAKTSQMANKIYFPTSPIMYYSLETCRFHTLNKEHIGEFVGYLNPHAWVEPSWRL